MIASVAASNYLVQIPVSDWLTVASLSYPIAFLVCQLLDVVIFDKLRRSAWWKAPLISTSISSAVDSYLFTFLAFYGDVTVHQSWAKLATGDYGIKITVA